MDGGKTPARLVREAFGSAEPPTQRERQKHGGKNMKAGHFFAAIFLPAVLSLVNAKTPGRKGAGKGGKGTRFLATWRLCVISVPLLDASRKAALARGRQKLQFSPARLQLV